MMHAERRQIGHAHRWGAAILILLVGVLTNAATVSANRATPPSGQTATRTRAPAVSAAQQIRTVNAPHFTGAVDPTQAAIFWFGAVSPATTYSDVRVGYTDSELTLSLNTIDRLLWYHTTNPQQDLTAWDADSLYLRLAGPSGAAPDTQTYRFDAGLSDGRNTAAYQAAYRGNGAGWVATPLAFTTLPGWRGNALNDALNDQGWALTYHIPFASLGLAGPPAAGTAWALGIVNHNRDDPAAPPLADTPWPEGLAAAVPATWGRLVFGLPGYQPPPTTGRQTVTIRNGLNGVTVADGGVGGYTTCGGALDYWTQWGNANYAANPDFNVQNEADISDFPCFAKYYVTFPLASLPGGQAITAAQLTLHQFGNSGAAGQAGSSLIQVATVGADWNAATLTWNNAPYALENVSAAWVDPLPSQPPWPGVARGWDVSRAMAQAYASGQPLRLVVYEADTAYHSGKYFVSGETGDWNAAGRPTLTVTLGSQTPAVPTPAPLPAPRPPSPPGVPTVVAPNPLPRPRP